MTVLFLKHTNFCFSSTNSIYVTCIIFIYLLDLKTIRVEGTCLVNPCINIGRTADEYDENCQRYFYCVYDGANFLLWTFKCPNSLKFHPIFKQCVSKKIYSCPEPKICATSTQGTTMSSITTAISSTNSTSSPASPTNSTSSPASPTNSTSPPASPTNSTSPPASPTNSTSSPASSTNSTSPPASPTNSTSLASITTS